MMIKRGRPCDSTMYVVFVFDCVEILRPSPPNRVMSKDMFLYGATHITFGRDYQFVVDVYIFAMEHAK